MMGDKPHIYAALPVMDELDNIQELIACIGAQSYKHFSLLVCVNQPEEWWEMTEKRNICRSNAETLRLLNETRDFECIVIDRSSRGKGWKGKQKGVGWARKLPMDLASSLGRNHDIIISLDADTAFNKEYFASIAENIGLHAEAVAVSVPYYHRLTGNESLDRGILRYEIYLRYYALNMWRIGNPYCFTAVGSAMAIPVWSYRRVGGITPRYSGEDFYFMQKLAKSGRIVHWNREKVFPAARFSDRVNFGTGPALIKGTSGSWSSYPIFPHEFFDEVGETFNLFHILYTEEAETPMDGFLRQQFREENIWQPLRDNTTTPEGFARLCAQKVDALRIFQYLRQKYRKQPAKDEESLISFLQNFLPEPLESPECKPEDFSFSRSPLDDLDKIRNALQEAEEKYQKKDFLWKH